MFLWLDVSSFLLLLVFESKFWSTVDLHHVKWGNLCILTEIGLAPKSLFQETTRCFHFTLISKPIKFLFSSKLSWHFKESLTRLKTTILAFKTFFFFFKLALQVELIIEANFVFSVYICFLLIKTRKFPIQLFTKILALDPLKIQIYFHLPSFLSESSKQIVGAD